MSDALTYTSLLALSPRAFAEDASPTNERRFEPDRLHDVAQKIKPIFEKKRPGQSGDWLSEHREEGQTFDQYLVRRRPVLESFRTMYVQPLGEFTETEEKVLALTIDFMTRYFGVPVKRLKSSILESLPENARRVHPTWKTPQVLSTYLLDEVLKPNRPRDAISLLGLTAEDLWPGMGWNFVFGQASLEARVGVWSLHRNGEPERSDEEYRRYLLRTLKTAVHETGHMLGIPHCIKYECCMNGSNHREESDRNRLEYCPECQPKLWWTLRTDPVKRTRDLRDFAEKHELVDEAVHWKLQAETLEG